MRVFAPGKVVLLGEYAVLDGAPALVAAVDRGVRCIVEPDATLRWTVPQDDRFVRAALIAVNAPPAHYRFEDARPAPTTGKVGLGGSAAATVAAVWAGSPSAPREERLAVAIRVHHAVQGSGSGVDVAASTYGGVLRWEAGRATAARRIDPSVIAVGRSAATGPRVERYLSWPDRSAFVAESRSIVDGFADDPIAALRAGGRHLRSMAEAAGLAYWTPAFGALAALAEDCGGACKPSGAGGGDIAVALFVDPAARAHFEGAARAAGYFPLDVALAEPTFEP